MERIYRNVFDSTMQDGEDCGLNEAQIGMLLRTDVSVRVRSKRDWIQPDLRHSQRLLGGESVAIGKELYAVKSRMLQIDQHVGYLLIAVLVVAVALVLALIGG